MLTLVATLVVVAVLEEEEDVEVEVLYMVSREW